VENAIVSYIDRHMIHVAATAGEQEQITRLE
jgi:hypothetical protein